MLAKKKILFIIAIGLIWFVMGGSLFAKGTKFLSSVKDIKEPMPAMIVGGSLLLGFLKGKFILSKSVKKVIHRLATLSSPLKAYTFKDYGIVLGMISLGILMNQFKISPFVRGCIDTAIGTALMYGGISYFFSLRGKSS